MESNKPMAGGGFYRLCLMEVRMTRCLSQLRSRLIHSVTSSVKDTPFVWRIVLIVLACGGITGISLAQSLLPSSSSGAGITDPCVNPSTHSAIKDAFRLVCAREGMPAASCIGQKAIVIGFLGGFVRRNDVKHPEALFADYLNSRYGPALHAEVFGNHEAKRALDLIMKRIDNNKEGPQVPADKKTAKIILYGHSWGASQVLTFARELETRGIPVALTVQVDSVRKMGQNDRTVPANVARAVNFYQRKGFTPGRPLVVPADAERTKILGNFHMIYKDPNIRCDNYRWFSRVLNKPHHLIENDPHVWDQIVSLIDSELALHPNVRAALLSPND